MRRPRGIAGLGLLLALGLALGVGGGATYAAFFDTAQNAGNSFEAADDLRPPVIDDTVIEGGGNVEGAIRAGGTYRVYATINGSACCGYQQTVDVGASGQLQLQNHLGIRQGSETIAVRFENVSGGTSRTLGAISGTQWNNLPYNSW